VIGFRSTALGWGIAAVLHWAASLGGFWLVLLLAAGAAERTAAEPVWLAALDSFVRFVLMQPIAYWVLVAGEIRFWTPIGLAVTAVVFALNSALVVALAGAVLSRWRGRAGDGRG
jgi:hypothetical protein